MGAAESKPCLRSPLANYGSAVSRLPCVSQLCETVRARPLILRPPGLPQTSHGFRAALPPSVRKARIERGFPGRDTEPCEWQALPGARKSRVRLASRTATKLLCARPRAAPRPRTANFAPLRLQRRLQPGGAGEAAPPARGALRAGLPRPPALLQTRQPAKAPLLKIGCDRPRSSEKRGRAAPERRGERRERSPGLAPPAAVPSGAAGSTRPPPAAAPRRGTCTMSARRSESLAMLSPHFLQEARPLLAYSARYSFSAGSAIAAAPAAAPPPRAARSP